MNKFIISISSCKLFFFTLITLGLTACGPKSLPFKYNNEDFAHNNKGVAIIRVSEFAANSLNKTDVNLGYTLKKFEQEGSYIIEANNNIFAGISNDYDYSQNILMLDPGVYYFDYISLLGNGYYEYWYPSPGIKVISSDGTENRCVIKYGAFKINAGEVNYIGHLHLDGGGVLPFKVINEIEKAKKDLANKGYQDLSQKLKTAEFYQSGSIYIKQPNKKNGLIISKQQIDRVSSHFFNKIADDLLKDHKK